MIPAYVHNIYEIIQTMPMLFFFSNPYIALCVSLMMMMNDDDNTYCCCFCDSQKFQIDFQLHNYERILDL